MSDLEEAGLLKQPHTSAGRVPTDQGLRFFVDSLLKVRTLSDKERVELAQRYRSTSDDIETALRDAAHVLSELSTHTAVLVTPRPDDRRARARRVHAAARRAAPGRAGRQERPGVRTRSSPRTEPISGDELERIHNYLNEILGRPHARRGARARAEGARRRAHAVSGAGEEARSSCRSRRCPSAAAPTVILSGQARLLENIARPSRPSSRR